MSGIYARVWFTVALSSQLILPIIYIYGQYFIIPVYSKIFLTLQKGQSWNNPVKLSYQLYILAITHYSHIILRFSLTIWIKVKIWANMIYIISRLIYQYKSLMDGGLLSELIKWSKMPKFTFYNYLNLCRMEERGYLKILSF